MSEQDTEPAPLIFGEVLFDCFPDCREVLGGAPFNVAWNLKGFGMNPYVISRVGNDERGNQIKQSMCAWAMSTAGLQTDANRPTGFVRIDEDDTGHSFEIIADCAYDAIDLEQALGNLPTGPSLIYHGSLALRTPHNQKTFLTLVQKLGAPLFCDVNLRAPWWSHDHVIQMVDSADYVKINDDELIQLSQKTICNDDELIAEAHMFQKEHSIKRLILTMGARGAAIITESGDSYRAPPGSTEGITDTVGAGDAFSSVIIMGILNNWEPGETLDRASSFATEVCHMRGATACDKRIYQREKKWN